MPNKEDPADAILDRIMPDATAEEREEARQNLRRLARALIHLRPLLRALDDKRTDAQQNPDSEVNSNSP